MNETEMDVNVNEAILNMLVSLLANILLIFPSLHILESRASLL